MSDATPTESEKEVYNVVSSVLDEAPRILHELQSYRGANEEIRQVSSHILANTVDLGHLVNIRISQGLS